MGVWGNVGQSARNLIYDIKHPSVLSTPVTVKPTIYFTVITICDGLWQSFVVFYKVVEDYHGKKKAEVIKIPSFNQNQKFEIANAVCTKGIGMLKPDELSGKYKVHDKQDRHAKANLSKLTNISFDEMEQLVFQDKAKSLNDFQHIIQQRNFDTWR